MYTILFYSTTYILLFYIFMLVRGTIPRYKVTTMLSLFWRILLLYATIFLMVITMVTVL